MTKFTVGSQWLTKGGWRAVVVDISKDHVTVYHTQYDETRMHTYEGKRRYEKLSEFDLIAPYTEPRKGTVWVNIWLDESDGEILIYPHETEESRMEDVNGPGSWKLIASFKHDWTENEKL